MSRVFLAERLSREVLDRYRYLHATAETCTAQTSASGDLTAEVLADPRWLPGNASLAETAQREATAFSSELVDQVMPDGGSWSGVRPLLVCALDARLQSAFMARQLVEHSLSHVDPTRAEVDGVASNPYVRSLLSHRPARTEGFSGRVRLHPLPGTRPMLQTVRELLAGQRLLRSRSWSQSLRRSKPAARAPKSQKLVLVFALSYRSIHGIAPVVEHLAAEGWRTVVVRYNPLVDRSLFPPSQNIELEVDLDVASEGWRTQARAGVRGWQLGPDFLSRSPFPGRTLRRALDAASTSSAVQMAKHQRILERWRPDAAVFFGPDVSTLALQAVAAPMGIPTVFVPHHFLYATPFVYWLPATLSLLYSADCVRLNQHVATQNGHKLLATGHPHFDALVGDRQRPPRSVPASLTIPPDRTHVVAAFGTYGADLVTHLHQARFARMVASGLPKNAFLIWKLHPGDNRPEITERSVRGILPPGSYQMVSEKELSTRDLLAMASVAISIERSTVIADAIVSGCPAIAVRQPEFSPTCMDHLHPAKDYDYFGRVVTTAPAVKAAIEDLTGNPDARERFLARRQEYLERLVICDGGAARRMALAIQSAAA